MARWTRRFLRGACAAAILCPMAIAAGGAPPAPAAAPHAAAPSAGTAASPWKVQEEHWYALKYNGTECGFSCERLESDGARVRTVTELEMRLDRMGKPVTVRSRVAFVETAEGKPLEAEVTREMGAAPIRTRYLFNADSIDVVEEQGARTDARRKPLPSREWLTPWQARQFVRKRVAGGAETLEYAALDAETGMERVEFRSKRTGAGTANVEGKSIATTTWATVNSMLQETTTEELSADGVVVASSTSIGGKALEQRLSTRQAVKQQRGGAEVMSGSFVPLAQDGRGLERARTAQLRLRAAAGTLPTIPSAGSQKATRVAPGEITVDIDVDHAQPAERGEDADARFRRASVMVDSEDKAVAALTKAALQDVSQDPESRVNALRAAVANHIARKDLASGFATASQAAATRAGDCTEHAVLLAACLRAAGIPARVASGLLYVEAFGDQRNSYGWHMWTQALVDGAWIDADAVLPAAGPRTHAGHLLVVTSAAEGSSMEADLARIVDFLGNLQIEVVTVDGKAPKPAPGAKPAPPKKPAQERAQ